MHGEHAGESRQLVGVLAGRLQCDHDADLAQIRRGLVVHVGAHDPLLDLKRGGAAHGHVLADGGDHLLDVLLDRRLLAGVGHGEQLGDVALGLGGERGDLQDHVLELLVAGDEVGLGVDLHDRARLARGNDANEPFGGDAPRLLGGLGQALLAQPVDGGLDVALRLRERRLAVHHPGAGLVAQFLHQARGNRHSSALRLAGAVKLIPQVDKKVMPRRLRPWWPRPASWPGRPTPPFRSAPSISADGRAPPSAPGRDRRSASSGTRRHR